MSCQENCISNLNQFEKISKRTTFSLYMHKRFLPFENTTLRWSIFKSSIPVLQHYVVISREYFLLDYIHVLIVMKYCNADNSSKPREKFF